MSLSRCPSQDTLDSPQWENVLGQLKQELDTLEQVSLTLKEANSAFAAQCTQPDADAYREACDSLTHFLESRGNLHLPEQKSLVDVLKVACGMHENTLNNRALTKVQRIEYEFASVSFIRLCTQALGHNITSANYWCDVLGLQCRVENALSEALAKFFAQCAADEFVESAETVATLPLPPTAPTPRASLHDIYDVVQAPPSAKLKEKALVMLNDRSPKGAPLGRACSLPALTRARSMSQTGRMLLNVCSRGRDLQVLPEDEE